MAFAQGPYSGLNQHHLQELLAEREGLMLSRSSVWRILSGAGMVSPKQRRRAQHRHRRERYPQEGMLLQVDGGRHDWLERRGSCLTLVGAIDDATGTVPYALFREQEDAQGYFLLLRGIIGSKGIPLALYNYRHSIFQVNPKQQENLEEQLTGERQPTQVGRALQELGIQSMVALSPPVVGLGGEAVGYLPGPLGQRVAPGRSCHVRGRQPGVLGLPAPVQRPFRRAPGSVQFGLPAAGAWGLSGRGAVLQVPTHGGQRQRGEAGRAHPTVAAGIRPVQLRPGPGGNTRTAGRQPGGCLSRQGHCQRRSPAPSSDATGS